MSAGGYDESYISNARHTILRADDDEVILCYEPALLTTAGYAVLTAASPRPRLRLANMCKCDTALLDYEAALEIQRVRPDLTVIMLSACEAPIHTLTMVDACVTKREASRELLPMIGELCSRPREAHKKTDLRTQDGSDSLQSFPATCYIRPTLAAITARSKGGLLRDRVC